MDCYKLYISPCPNDTFAFYGLIHRLIDMQGLSFSVQYEDIDMLNQRAVAGDGDVIKVSCASLGLIDRDYTLLGSGAALGYGNAPLVVIDSSSNIKTLDSCLVAIPGEHTTAARLLRRFFPLVKTVTACFSDIAEMVACGEVDAGILIHEGRFTYQDRGLRLFSDLGELWDKEFRLPIPLGCIVARKSVGDDITDRIEQIIRSSVEYALSNPEAPMNFVRSHAQEMDDDVLQKHISYFVNDFTVDLGTQGREAIEVLNQ